MKKLMICLLALALAGCGTSVSQAEVNAAMHFCRDKTGLGKITKGGFGAQLVQCNDTTTEYLRAVSDQYIKYVKTLNQGEGQ